MNDAYVACMEADERRRLKPQPAALYSKRPRLIPFVEVLAVLFVDGFMPKIEDYDHGYIAGSYPSYRTPSDFDE